MATNHQTLPLMRSGSVFSNSSSTFYKSSDIIDSPRARALVASHNHKEAEKRRRERINSHLNTLRNLLPCNSKTDKASLLAKVVQRLRELKHETSEIVKLETFPSETDEIVVLSNNSSSDGRILIKASLCCEDRSDLVPNLIETLRAMKCDPLRLEMASLGGRIRNIIMLECNDTEDGKELVHVLKEALGLLVTGSHPRDRLKRRRIFDDNQRFSS